MLNPAVLVPAGITLVGMVFFIFFLKNRLKATTAKSTIIKSMVSLCFMLVGFSSFFCGSGTRSDMFFRALVCGGLLFGLLGDIWLDLKFAHVESGTVYTYAGFCSFLAGHIFYDSALIFRYQTSEHPDGVILPLAIALFFAVFIIFSEKLLKVEYGEYKRIVILYSFMLASFVAFAIGYARLASFKDLSLNIMAAGSILFAVSDLILNGTYFGHGKNRPSDIAVNHITYYMAQFAIAFSLSLLK